MKQHTLKEEILEQLNNNSKYIAKNKDINTLYNQIKKQIIDIIESPFFDPFNDNVALKWADEICWLLWKYYYFNHFHYVMSKRNTKQVSKEVKKDIKTIQSFLDLMNKNDIYNPKEQYIQNKDDKFVYDYCNNLIKDLYNKDFIKSKIYEYTKFKTSKNDLQGFFKEILAEEYPQLKIQDDIKSFIDSI